LRSNLPDPASKNEKAVMESRKIPYGKINAPQQLGSLVRTRRRRDGLTQAALADLSGVGTRFLSELESGKPTLELGKVLQVLDCLGIDLCAQPGGWARIDGPIGKAPIGPLP